MSGKVAVHAEGLAKKYTIGQLEGGYALMRRLVSRQDRRSVKWALDDVSFEVEEGQAMAIIGRNGAGKSTLLKILSRITEPTRGFADIRGRVGALLEVGTGFHPELTGRENVFLNGSILGMRRSEVVRNFDDIVEFAGVGEFIDTPVKRYSSGMYVRLAFASAAFLQPEILIVDEVLAVGDAEFQKRCLGRMNEVAKTGRTVLFVSHNMQAVRRLCSHGILLENGQLVTQGDIDSVVRHYLASVESTEQGLRRWDDEETQPGDDLCRVVSVAATNARGVPSSTFLSSQPIHITMEFDLSAVDSAFSAGFELVAFDSTVVFRTDFTDASEEVRPVMTKGRNVLTCTIPPGLLNTGRYSISLRLSLHWIRWIVREDHVLQFDVIGDHGDSLFLNGQKRPGVINPILDWQAAWPSREAADSAAASVPDVA
jgi:lipopolysaccharide transport system ATP-binding protein